jgi:hypothetical protein
MIHEFDHSNRVDLMVGQTEENNLLFREENEMLMASAHNGKDHFDDLSEAFTETDVLLLRDKLREISLNRKHSPKFGEVPFDLSENLTFEDVLDETSLEELSQLPNGKPMPRIHLHHHKRALTENQHLFYLDQIEAGKGISADDPDEYAMDDLPWLEEALQEKDIMSLREKLQHISVASIRSNHSSEEIENYLEGDITEEQLEVFEADLALDPILNGDVGLYAQVDEALKESDILAIRGKLERVMQSEHSGSKTLVEIEAYLDGEITGEQREEFGNEMFEHRDLRAEVNLLRNLEKSLLEKDVHSLRAKLGEIALQSEQEGRKTGSFLLIPEKKGKLIRNGTFAAIFLVLIGLSALMFNMMGNHPPGYEDYFRNPQLIGTSRSIDDVTDPVLLRGLDDLKKLRYPEALVSFESALLREKPDYPARFYSGYTSQKLNRDADALVHFSHITGAEYNMFTQQAEWYAILSKIRLHGIKSTLGDLNAIIDRKEFYYKDALALKMRLLKDIK